MCRSVGAAIVAFLNAPCVIALKILTGIKRIPFLIDPCEHIQCRAWTKGAGHHGHRSALCCCALFDLFRQEQNRRGKEHAPLAGCLLLAQHLTIEISDFGVAVQVDLHHEKVVADVVCDVGAGEHLVMHLGAIDAAPLFDHQCKALAFGIGLGEILAQILERVAHPRGFMQPVIAEVGGKAGHCDQNQQGDQAFHVAVSLRCFGRLERSPASIARCS
mmetsp:Transcript_5391/g.8524  ORF Transcript_5391/g.8524 Transcript_5391/m.8524 type:complete len:217 (+) Transcript_5391:53-703(+)